MDLNKAADKLSDKFEEITGTKITHYASDKKESELDEEYEEQLRLQRIDEIADQANDARIARCERKMAEVGKDEFMNLIHGRGGESGKEFWSDSEPNEITDIEKEYYRLRNEQFHLDWLREHDGKPYDMKDDPNAKF